jgi:hypothetical protein
MKQYIVLGLAVLAVVAAAYLGGRRRTSPRVEITTETLTFGLGKPVLWVYYNDSDVNARHWADFGARSSRALNIPVMNLFYETIVAQNGGDYRVEVIGGLTDLAVRLGVDALPEPLRNPLASVGEAEEDWIRAAVLAKFGGLWVSQSVICLRPFGALGDNVVAFGQDDVPLYGSSRSVPGFRALYAPRAEHPMFVEWEARCRSRLNGQLGGRQFRGDAKSDWNEIAPKYKPLLKAGELGRDPQTGKKLDLEELLAVGTEGVLPFDVPESTIYVVMPLADLLSRRAFGWFLRMSEEQVMGSDLVVRYLLEDGLAQRVPAGLAQRVPAGLAQRVPTGLAQRVPAGLAQRVPAGLAQRVPTGLAQRVPTGLAQRVPA